jgi:PAS domain S-box-containing protein
MSSHVTRLENLLEAVPEALVGVDQSGMIRFINHQTESLFGYDRGNLIGQPIRTLVPEDLWGIYTAHREGYFADPKTWAMGLDLEVIARQRDGTEFAVNVTLSPIDTGDVLVLVKAAGDVTKRREALENAQRMTAIVSSSEDAIIGMTRDGIITSWNPAAERIYGYSSEEMAGQTMDALIPQDRASEMKAILAKVRAGQAVDHPETIRIRKDGVAITVSISVSSIRDDDGAIIGASTITHEVTKEMEAFEAARAMIESSLDSLVAISPEGVITDVNEATAKVTGIPREELIGTSFSDYFTDPEKANAIYQLVFAKGMAVDYPLTMRRRDGTLTEVLYNASVYRNSGGKVLGVFAAARDVTQQNRAQREIAEQRSRERERLAELEQFHRLTVGRELKMIELKKQNEHLRSLIPPHEA